MGGVETVAAAIEADLARRLPREWVTQRRNLAWLVRETSETGGAIGFAEQRVVLDQVAAWLPEGVRPVLMGDRFYGGPDLIAWCAAHGWSWRLRLKSSLLVYDRNGGETTLKACFEEGAWLLEDIRLSARQVPSRVAIAVYWAVSTGMWDQQTQALTAERKSPEQRPAWCYRSWVSLFTRGLRRLHHQCRRPATPLEHLGN